MLWLPASLILKENAVHLALMYSKVSLSCFYIKSIPCYTLTSGIWGFFRRYEASFSGSWSPDFWESPLFSSSLSLLPLHPPRFHRDLPENPDLLFPSLGRRSICTLPRLPKPFHLFPGLFALAWLLLFPLPRKPSPPLWPLEIPPIPQNLPACQLQLRGWDPHLAPQFTCCGTLGKALNYTEPQFAILQIEDSIKGCLKDKKLKSPEVIFSPQFNPLNRFPFPSPTELSMHSALLD